MEILRFGFLKAGANSTELVPPLLSPTILVCVEVDEPFGAVLFIKEVCFVEIDRFCVDCCCENAAERYS